MKSAKVIKASRKYTIATFTGCLGFSFCIIVVCLKFLLQDVCVLHIAVQCAHCDLNINFEWHRLDDEILTVNNVSLGGVTHMQAVQALKDAGQHVILVSITHTPCAYIFQVIPSKKIKARQIFRDS